VAEAENGQLVARRWVTNLDLEEEPVELRLGEGVGAFVLVGNG
jgi:hypothetical protein